MCFETCNTCVNNDDAYNKCSTCMTANFYLISGMCRCQDNYHPSSGDCVKNSSSSEDIYTFTQYL